MQEIPVYKTGKLPAIASQKSLSFASYLPKAPMNLPTASKIWQKKDLPLPMFGNDEHGDCTIASQAIATLRMERFDQRKTVVISDQEVIDRYYAMTSRYYGGGDTGAYEMDALSDWRKEEYAFRDEKKRPYIIDAFVRVNQYNLQEWKTAMWLAKAHGLKVCFSLPAAWQGRSDWDLPEGQMPIGPYQPGTWGGHSCFAEDYDAYGVIVPTWNTRVRVSWRAFPVYCDESYLVIDKVNSWKKKVDKKEFNLAALVSDVNMVSSKKIAA